MARRVRKRRVSRAGETALTLDDLRFPGEKRVYLEGVLGIPAFFVIVAYNLTAFGVLNEARPGSPLYHQYWIPAVVLLYPALAWFVASWLALRPQRRRIREAGISARVLNKSHPKLKAILAQQSRMLGLPEPEMYVLGHDSALMYSLPGKSGIIVTTEATVRVMTDEELEALVAREIGHIACRHPRMLVVAHYMRRANPALKVLLFPTFALAIVLGGWLELTEVTADRIAVVVTGRPALVNETLVKLAVAADRESEITPEELEAFLATATDVSTDAAQIERHYKMGEFLDKHKSLRERIDEVRQFARSDDGQYAMAKVAEARQKLA
ncbi:MAG: M48 family metallopeptidase [Armatimonadota bacterium]